MIGTSTKHPRLSRRCSNRRLPRSIATTLALLTLCPGAALAQAATPVAPRGTPERDPARDLNRLETLLQHYQAEEASYRLWSGLSAVATGGAMASLGLVINSRSGNESWVGPLLIVAGTIQFAGGASTIIAPLVPPPTGFAHLGDLLARQRAAGRPPSEVTRLIESEWERLAQQARSDRHFTGAVGLVGAPLVIGAGTYLMLAKPSRFSEQGRYGTAALLFGLGTVGLARSVYSLLVESNMEVAYNTYRLTARPEAARLAVGYAAAPGGGSVRLSISF